MPDLGHFATCFADSPGLLSNLAEIPIAVTGTWVKDGHRFSITKEDLDDICKNFSKRGNGQVVVDYEHASERPEVAKGGPIPAAAWIHDLKMRGEDGKEILWASVEWTPKAKGLIQGGEYRYFSPAIDWGATDKKTGRSKGATLTSGALTNHPFLEELPAIQLSEAKSTGKQIVVPVIDGAKIKVKVDAKHDDDTTLASDTTGDPDHATVSGEKVHRSDFAYVGDPKDKSTWKLPVHDKGHAENALARFNQADIPADKKTSVAKKLVSAAKKHGINTFGFEKKNLSEETMPNKVELDDMDAYGVEGDRGDQDTLRKQAEKRAGKIDTPSDGDETEELSAKTLGDDDDDDAPTPGGNVPRFSIRKMRPADKVGKLSHHAVVSGDGKLAGYITHGDLKNHANKFAESGRTAGTLKATDLAEEIKEATGRPLTLTEVTQFVERGITASDSESRRTAHKTLLSSAISDNGSFNARSARRLLAEEKISMRDYADFEDAVEDVSKAINEGQFLPKQRASLVALCLSDRANFEEMVKAQPKSERLSMVGIGGTGDESTNPDAELHQRIDQLIKENKDMSYGTAYTKVLASDTALAERYNKVHRRLM